MKDTDEKNSRLFYHDANSAPDIFNRQFHLLADPLECWVPPQNVLDSLLGNEFFLNVLLEDKSEHGQEFCSKAELSPPTLKTKNEKLVLL